MWNLSIRRLITDNPFSVSHLCWTWKLDSVVAIFRHDPESESRLWLVLKLPTFLQDKIHGANTSL